MLLINLIIVCEITTSLSHSSFIFATHAYSFAYDDFIFCYIHPLLSKKFLILN